MNVKEHLSKETLASLLTDGSPNEMSRMAALHLSYCTVCREQKNELALELAARRMWEAYERSDSPTEPHVEDIAFRRFWLGELRDEELVRQISRHCVVCRDCRARRELIRAESGKERVRARVWALGALAVMAGWFIWKKRYYVLGVASAAVLIVTLMPLFLLERRAIDKSPNQAAGNMTAAVPSEAARNYNSARLSPSPGPSFGNSSEIKAPPPRPTPPRAEPTPVLLARAQIIDLNRAPGGAAARAPDDQETGPQSHFKIIASRTGPTLLRINLLRNSKRGAYRVSIRDPAFLGELVPAEGRSPDGASLSVTIDLRNLTAGEYVLRIERRPPGAGEEYVGDYTVFVDMPASANDRPARTAPSAGANEPRPGAGPKDSFPAPTRPEVP